MVPLSLPLNNPKAAVATLADLFDRAYIEAVVSGLQRFLENGYLESLLEPPALESTTDDPGMASDTAVETGEHE